MEEIFQMILSSDLETRKLGIDLFKNTKFYKEYKDKVLNFISISALFSPNTLKEIVKEWEKSIDFFGSYEVESEVERYLIKHDIDAIKLRYGENL